MNLPTLLAALLCLAPHTPERIAARHARTILATTSDEDEIAALLVTGTRESEWRLGCVQGIGGAGTYGLGVGYQRWACGPLKIQVQMSLQAYRDKGAPWNWKGAFVHYLGAKSLRHPEARRRVEMFELTRERLACSCCI